MEKDFENNLHITLTPFTHESRILKETKSLIRMGLVDRVKIVALGNPGLKEFEQIDESRSVDRIHLKSRSLPKDLFSQIIKYFEFCFKIITTYKDVQVVNCHSLACLPIGAVIKFLRGARLIYDPHELETEASGLFGLRKRLSKFVERLLIRYSDAIIVVSKSIATHYRDTYDIPEPATVTNCPSYQKVKASDLFRSHFNLRKDQRIFLYQGGLSPGRGIEKTLEAFSLLENDENVAVFMGYGPLETEIKDFAEKHKNIYFHEAVPPDELLQYTASADFGVFLCEKSSLSYYYCLPNKLFEYIMAGLPVITTDMPEMRRVITENSLGYILENDSPESFAQFISALDCKNEQQMRSNSLAAAQILNWESQEEEIQNVYRSLWTFSELSNQNQLTNAQS